MRYLYYPLSVILVSCLFGVLMSYIAYSDGGNQQEYRTVEGGVVWENVMSMFWSSALLSLPFSIILAAGVYVIGKDVVNLFRRK